MSYAIEFTSSAKKDLKMIPVTETSKIFEEIEKLQIIQDLLIAKN
jgi:mRNA-degrading endonuclease RelE of RelBE toxin-antitoxin system